MEDWMDIFQNVLVLKFEGEITSWYLLNFSVSWGQTRPVGPRRNDGIWKAQGTGPVEKKWEAVRTDGTRDWWLFKSSSTGLGGKAAEEDLIVWSAWHCREQVGGADKQSLALPLSSCVCLHELLHFHPPWSLLSCLQGDSTERLIWAKCLVPNSCSVNGGFYY